MAFENAACCHFEFSDTRDFNICQAICVTVADVYHFNGRRGQETGSASAYQITSKSLKTLQRYSDITVFKMAAVRHLGFLKFKFFNGLGGQETHSAAPCQMSRRSVNPLLGYRDFCDFQHGGRCHVGFSKIRNFNGLSPVEAYYASPYQISSKSVKQLRVCGDMSN